MALKGNACIGQSGGPTIVINSSLVGAIEEAEEHAEIDRFYGAMKGIEGVLYENFIDLFREDDQVIRDMSLTPSAALGTCRTKPNERDRKRCMEVFKAHNIRYFFYNGGNDSQLTCHLISELAKESDWDMRVIGIPKTIDNDLPVTDNCPGYGSAARVAATAVQTVARDARAFGTAEVIEMMGRDAGWLTGATQVGRQEPGDAPHLVYLPEVEVDINEFLEDCHDQYEKWGYLVVAVSEGFSFADTDIEASSEKVDEFGHARLGGVASALSDMLEEDMGVRCRYDELGNLQRAFAPCASQVDHDQAYAVGGAAVSHAVEGETDVMMTIDRKSNDPYEYEIGSTSLMSVAGKTRLVPDEWINQDKNGVTDDFIQYARPLMMGAACPTYEGLPEYPVFQKHFIDKKLDEYVREEE